MPKLGIDISHWQGDIDFEQVRKAGYAFAIIKAGGADAGYYKDPRFEEYYSAAIKSGLGVGAYYFTGPTFYTVDQGEREADHFLSLIKGKLFSYPIAVDIEAVPTERGKKAITDACIAFCRKMEQFGYYISVYASDIAGFANRLDINRLQAYDKWVARYNTKGPSYVSQYGMWQFGGSFNYLRSPKVPGVSSAACDQDYAYKDYPTIIKNAGLNGYVNAGNTNTNLRDICIQQASEGDRNKIATLADSLGLKYVII